MDDEKELFDESARTGDSNHVEEAKLSLESVESAEAQAFGELDSFDQLDFEYGPGSMEVFRAETKRRNAELDSQGEALEALRVELDEYKAALRRKEQDLTEQNAAIDTALTELGHLDIGEFSDGAVVEAGLAGWLQQFRAAGESLSRRREDLEQQAALLVAERTEFDTERRLLEAQQSEVTEQLQAQTAQIKENRLHSDLISAELVETRSQLDLTERQLEIANESIDQRCQEIDLLREEFYSQAQVVDNGAAEIGSPLSDGAATHERALELDDREAELTTLAHMLDERQRIVDVAEYQPVVDEMIEVSSPSDAEDLLTVSLEMPADVSAVYDEGAPLELTPPPASDRRDRPTPKATMALRGAALVDSVWAAIVQENQSKDTRQNPESPDRRHEAAPYRVGKRVSFSEVFQEESSQTVWDWLQDRTFRLPDDFSWRRMGISAGATAATGALLLPLLKAWIY
jgi:hypothetical protein